MSGLEPLAIAAIVGAGASAAGTIYSGWETRRAAEEAAKRDERAGQAEFAASQREAEERKLEGALVMSRQQAAAAASGAGAGDDAPTIVKLMTETAKRQRYGVESTLFGGRQRRQTYIETAQARRQTGDANFLGSILTGIGQAAGGFY
jgi:hypothetical protein